MMVIEMRQAAKDRAFDLLDEIKDLGRKKKMAICELEETLYECFESSDEDEDEYKDVDEGYEPTDEEENNMDFRRKSYRYGRRYDMQHEGDDMEDGNYRSYRRRAMRMRRRNRMGRFV